MVKVLVDAAFAAVGNGRQLVGELRAIRASWHDRVGARRDSPTWQVADLLLRRPVVNAPLIAAETRVRLNNVYRALQPLLEAGVLHEQTSRRRDRVALRRGPAGSGCLRRLAGGPQDAGLIGSRKILPQGRRAPDPPADHATCVVRRARLDGIRPTPAKRVLNERGAVEQHLVARGDGGARCRRA